MRHRIIEELVALAVSGNGNGCFSSEIDKRYKRGEITTEEKNLVLFHACAEKLKQALDQITSKVEHI